MDRSETEVDLDLKYLQEKLALLEEPPLPPSLTAEALFRRLDAGELSLPEQAPGEEPPEEQASPEVPAEAPDGKVLPWSRPLRRWGGRLSSVSTHSAASSNSGNTRKITR